MEEILASIRRIIADDQPLPPVREPETRGLAPLPENAAASPAEVAAAPVERASAIPSQLEEPERSDPPLHVLPDPAPAATHPHIAAPQFPVMPEGTMAPLVPDEPEVVEAAAPVSAEDADPVFAPVLTAHDHAYGEPRGDEAPYRAQDSDRGEAAFHRQSPAPEALFSKATDHSVTAAFNALAATRLADNSEELLGIAREMIRPLLKAWIDDNLPSMVERMVRAEIERVARGGR